MLINIDIFFKFISRAVYPRKCIGCNTSDFWVCEKCAKQIPKSSDNPFSWSYSVFEYRSKSIRKAIWLIKFNKKYSAIYDLQKIIKEGFDKFIEKYKLTNKNIILIPIPITKKSMSKRRYNQSSLICKVLTKDRPDLIFDESILLKSKNHIAQNKIKNRAKRLENIKNSFIVKNPEKIKGKTIVLVDDVVTTGATLKEAKSVLVKSGAKKVLGFSLAH